MIDTVITGKQGTYPGTGNWNRSGTEPAEPEREPEPVEPESVPVRAGRAGWAGPGRAGPGRYRDYNIDSNIDYNKDYNKDGSPAPSCRARSVSLRNVLHVAKHCYTASSNPIRFNA